MARTSEVNWDYLYFSLILNMYPSPNPRVIHLLRLREPPRWQEVHLVEANGVCHQPRSSMSSPAPRRRATLPTRVHGAYCVP